MATSSNDLLRIRIETRTDWQTLRDMDLRDHLRATYRDTRRAFRLIRHHPRATADVYGSALKRCFTFYDDNSHFRKGLIFSLGLFNGGILTLKTATAWQNGGSTGVIDIPFIILVAVWGMLVMFELGQEIDSVSILDAGIDFDTSDDSSNSEDD